MVHLLRDRVEDIRAKQPAHLKGPAAGQADELNGRVVIRHSHVLLITDDYPAALGCARAHTPSVITGGFGVPYTVHELLGTPR